MSILARDADQGIANRAFGLPRKFLMTGEETGGARSVWVEEVPVGAGPPRHVQHTDDELFYIIKGQFRFYAGDAEREVGPGGVILVPRGVPHTFKNIGEVTGELLIEMTPGGIDRFFMEVEEKRLTPPDDMPAIAELAARYNLEFVGPPPS